MKVQNDAKTAGRNRDKAIQAVESIKSELLEIEERQKTIAEETEKLAAEFQEVTDDKTELEEAAEEIAKKVEEASKNVEKFEKEWSYILSLESTKFDPEGQNDHVINSDHIIDG